MKTNVGAVWEGSCLGYTKIEKNIKKYKKIEKHRK